MVARMTPENPTEVLRHAGLPFRLSNNQLITTCPFCNKPEHMYVHAMSGLWDCKRCGEKGNLHRLSRSLGVDNRASFQSLRDELHAERKRIPIERVDALHRALLDDPDALEYCTNVRRWSLDVLKRMKIGLRTDTRGKWLAYPWLSRGECAGMKYRIMPAFEKNHPQRFERETGYESVLYNIDVLDRYEEIILCAGEADLLALLSIGVENVVATTTGESSIPLSGVDALTKKRKVLSAYDNDAGGQRGKREVVKRLGIERVFAIALPDGVKDVNDFVIRGGTREAFEVLSATATQFDVPTVLSLPDSLDRLEEQTAFDARNDVAIDTTPWPSLNKRVSRWRGGNLIILSGPQGTGKTTCGLNICAAWAAKGLPALFYCLEMTAAELMQHVLSAHFQLDEEQITPAIIDKARRELVDWRLYFGSDPRLTKPEEVIALLRHAVKRYGVRLLVFDNAHSLGRRIEHRTEEVGVISKSFKALAMELDIPVVLIAQPRKLPPSKVMTPWDLKDSVDLFSDADEIIILHREHLAPLDANVAVSGAADDGILNLSSKALVRVAKARHRPASDGLLFFEGAQHRFREIRPEDLAPPKSDPSSHFASPHHHDA